MFPPIQSIDLFRCLSKPPKLGATPKLESTDFFAAKRPSPALWAAARARHATGRSRGARAKVRAAGKAKANGGASAMWPGLGWVGLNV